jgi:hypothetical protein
MGLAVSVDLGWPWWVTTIIAAAVAVAAGLAFVVTRHPLARGVLATLAVQGVVLAAVAPALMDNGDGSMSAMQPSTQLTAAEYARQADANCARVYKFAATLGKPKTLPAAANMLDRLLPAFWNAWLEQGLLQPPPEEQQVARQWMGAMRSYASSLEGVRHAARRGDQHGVNAANLLVNRHAQETGGLSSQLGMKVCFR